MSQQTRERDTSAPWTEADVPDQSGLTAVITGGNSGIGFEVARVLAQRGARLFLGCRDQGKAHDAVAKIRAVTPGAEVRVVPLDLASLRSVRAVAGSREKRASKSAGCSGSGWCCPVIRTGSGR